MFRFDALAKNVSNVVSEGAEPLLGNQGSRCRHRLSISALMERNVSCNCFTQDLIPQMVEFSNMFCDTGKICRIASPHVARDELLVGFRVPLKPPKDGGLVGIGALAGILSSLVESMVERGLYGCCKFEQSVCPLRALVVFGDKWH
ncbi:MAG: hypothetical protein AA908_08025 [Chlorobi bacterium NICIL-2]|nr:MAG: hypothetical protein AA908_08025 [Chlorobi bacterium NICIL-2]